MSAITKEKKLCGKMCKASKGRSALAVISTCVWSYCTTVTILECQPAKSLFLGFIHGQQGDPGDRTLLWGGDLHIQTGNSMDRLRTFAQHCTCD